MRRMGRWTDWLDIPKAISKAGPLGGRYGLYRLQIVRHSRGQRPQAVRIGRLVGWDTEGILYIGRSGFRRGGSRDIANRIDEFTRGHHSAGERFKNLHSTFPQSRFKLQASGLSIEIGHIRKAEASALQKYIRIHRELPPLNNNQPHR